MFCRGEDGYSIDILQVNPVTREPVQKNVSYMNFTPRNFQGITYETFQGVCKAIGLLEYDTHLKSCFMLLSQIT